MIVEVASRAVAIGGVVAGLVVLRTGRFPVALRTMLDLWTAAGLLRLSEDVGWDAIAGAAAVVLLRHFVGSALFEAPAPATIRSRCSPPPPSTSSR